ncbi:MAG: ATP-grasp domain-containing protein [Candidatus Nomurabacteria bacterium]|nr:ATP-grasp domain-containing protein [Candidatus Nomurabacteria bacterium]
MIKVGVIRGGFSSEYETSLRTGENVLSHLRRDPANAMKYTVYDILLDKEGVLHLHGLPISIQDLSKRVDVVVNALHGEFGEDGRMQQLLEQHHIPYTGSKALSSSIGFNKVLLKNEIKKLGLKTPQHFIISAYQESMDGELVEYAQKKAKEVFRKLSPPWIIKPLSSGSSFGIHICNTLPELIKTFQNTEVHSVSLIVEELISGKKAHMNVIENFRGKELYSLPSVEIREDQNICPGNFSNEEKKELGRLAETLHSKLYLNHYSNSEFVVTPKRGIYVLNIKTLPELSEESNFSKTLSSVGSNIPEFIDHIIDLALAKK